jgi:photosystem II stability/assembly factor-like uncharacterized protein
MKRLGLVIALVALATFAAISAQADVTVGHSGWSWGTPLPQGNTLRAVEFEGPVGYAAGDFGTLLRSTDGGATWTGVRTDTTDPLTRISIPDANTVLVGGGCTLLASSDGGKTFKGRPLKCGGSSIASLTFPSASHGYVLLANGSLLRTTDGGTTFTAGGTIPGTPADVFFTDSSTGFAVTHSSTNGGIYRTTDGGSTWFPRGTSAQPLNGVFFPTAGTGYAVGNSNMVLKTTDGGETWNPKAATTAPTADLTSIRCADVSTCVASTAAGDRVIRTRTGGDSYDALTPSTSKVFAMSLISAAKGVAVGADGAIVISTNLAATSPSFVPVGGPTLQGSFGRLRASSASLAVAAGQAGKLARSSDGGRHWATMQLPTSEDLRDAWFVSDQVGFALDAAGGVLRTTDGGGGWNAIGDAQGAQPNAIYAVDKNVVLLFGPKGVRRATSGANPRFTVVASKVASGPTLSDYDRAGDGTVFAFGRRALIASGNAGASWRRIAPPVKHVSYRRVDFVSATTGYALLTSGRLFKTRNAGKTWREVVSTGTAHAYDLSFADARHGFLSLDRFGSGSRAAWVLRTSDGGATWRPQLIAPTPLDFLGLASPDPTHGFGIAAGAQFFYTSTGGDADATPSLLTLTPRRSVVHNARGVKVDGWLTPSPAGAVVTVLARNARTHRWTVLGTRHATGSGKFSITCPVSQTTQLVAQWPGGGGLSGAGSPVATIVKKG